MTFQNEFVAEALRVYLAAFVFFVMIYPGASSRRTSTEGMTPTDA